MRYNLRNKSQACYLAEIAEKVYGVDPLDTARTRTMVYARSAISLQLIAEGETYEAIGSFFNKDHSSVYYAIKKHPDWMKYDRDYREHYNKFLIEMGKPINQEEYTLEEIRGQVKRLSNKLQEFDYDANQIKNFWMKTVFDN
jgi:hypothetical protein